MENEEMQYVANATERMNEDGEGDERTDGRQTDFVLPISIVSAAVMIAAALVYNGSMRAGANRAAQEQPPAPGVQKTDARISALAGKVIPSSGVTLPITWGDMGRKMVEAGVIDPRQFEALYKERGGLSPDAERLLSSENDGAVAMTAQNSGVILNLLWAFGLGNKSDVLDAGPMRDPKYGDAGRFASTGGWTLSVGNPMSHYSKHTFVTLTSDQKRLVERVAKGIYRPCCGNATYFLDCNHGMAMLGLLELMASQNVSEDQMYKTALAVNSYWFPDAYMTIAQYLENKGIDWNSADPREILGVSYSSAQGYQQIVSQTTPVQTKSSGGCGV